MATIRTAIQVQDKMTPAFHSMNKALNIVLNTFEQVQAASSKSIDTASIQAARNELAKAEVVLNNVEEEIHNANSQQEKFNNSLSKGSGCAEGLLNKIKGIVLAYGSVKGIEKIFELSDKMTTTKARLNLIVDDGGSVEELENKIFASAMRSRAEYQTQADIVAKLGQRAGKAFKNNDETIAFAEQLSKLFVIAGASQQEMASASLQLTQALGSGVLRGEELNAVFEAAPNVIQKIADYMDVPIGQIRTLASEGKISANIVKNALLSGATETNEAFEKMPMTWEQIATQSKNILLKAFQPALEKINEIANNPKFTKVINSVVGGLALMGEQLVYILDLAINFASIIIDNWSIAEPIIMGLAVAIGIYTAALIIYNTIKGISAIVEGVHAAAMAMSTGATFAATAAQYGFNAALLACPLTWIVIGIIAVIAAVYACVAAYNKWTNSTVSATGLIMGYVYTLAAYWYNRFIVPIWNALAALANFFANVFNDPCTATKVLFYELATTVLGYIETMAKGIEDVINKIPGVSVDITSGLSNFRSELEMAAQEAKDQGEWVEVVGKLDYWDYSDAMAAGYSKGQQIESAVSNFSVEDFFNKYANIGSGNELDLSNLGSNVGNIADDTGSMKNSLDCTEEDLKYLRDIAEQEVINRFTTAEIKIDMTNNNNINNNNDIDGIVSDLEEKLQEAMETAAEGVYD